MITHHPFRIRFSGITIRFVPQEPIGLGKELMELLCPEDGPADAEYLLSPLITPLSPDSPPVYNNQGTLIYRQQEGWLRIYPMLISEDGCQVACLLRSNGKNVMYYPAAMWSRYTNPVRCASFLGLELVLLRRNGFFLHSSVVQLHGKAVLFCGPSEVGKSTQADLWHKHLGAEIINGDRCVVMKKADGFYGGGSPLAGSSDIYRAEQYPIAGIFLLEKAESNQVQRQTIGALPTLISQTLVNSWDTGFMEGIGSLFQDLLAQVPIYKLRCMPNQEAVQLACQTLFGKE